MYCYHIHPAFFPYTFSWIPPVPLFLNFAFLLLKTIYPYTSNYCFSNGWEIINWNIAKLTLVTTAKERWLSAPDFPSATSSSSATNEPHESFPILVGICPAWIGLLHVLPFWKFMNATGLTCSKDGTLQQSSLLSFSYSLPAFSSIILSAHRGLTWVYYLWMSTLSHLLTLSTFTSYESVH